jgi:hypothetical protein
MFKQLRSFASKTVFFAAIIAAAPALQAQATGAVIPGSAAYDALPAAISPALTSASAVPASYSSQTFSTIHIPDANKIEPVRQTAVEELPSRRNWLILSATSSGAAAFDAYSTRRSVESGNVEANPLMKPFAGSPAIYVALQASPLVMDYAAVKMQHSRNLLLRRMWWLPQSTGTAMSIFAGAHNLSITH